MYRPALLIFLSIGYFSLTQVIDAQSFKVGGTVTDFFTKQPLNAVTIRSSSGRLTLSDSLGKYSIEVNDKDSIWFSYLTKNTQKYPVDTIVNLSNFEVALYIDAAWLPEVRVRNKSYTLDSLQNREDYAKVFNFRKPGLRLSSPSPESYVPGGLTVGLDLDELINVFRFKRTRQILSFQRRLLQEEQDKYIDHRFTKRLVAQLTGLKTPSLEPFMVYARPPYDILTYMNDLELGYYIEQSFKIYKDVLKQKIYLSNKSPN